MSSLHVEFHRRDILETDAPYLVQCNNTLCTRSHGISKTIEEKFSYCTVYSERKAINGRNLAIVSDRPKVGTCKTYSPPPFHSGGKPTIACLFSQFDYGSCAIKSFRPQMPSFPDSKENRIIWFTQALNDLGPLIDKKSRVSFPYGIACGLGGGDWSVYLTIILTWASHNKLTPVFYYMPKEKKM